MGNLIKSLYILLGLVALVVGAVGAFLPILPTTPFLLLSLYCFSKGSKRWHSWFISTKLYKKHLEDFVRRRALTLKKKALILLFADIMLIFPLIILNNYVRVLLVLLILYKYYYFIFKIKTINSDNIEEKV